MEIFKTNNPDCKLFRPRVFEDDRGFFYEGFSQKKIKNELGIDFNIVQINQSKSIKNVLRGIHFQVPPYGQAKLVSVIEGEVIDVAVDLRKNSEFYGKTEKVLLSADNKKHFFIPKGFGHGFMVLSDEVKFMYGVDKEYSPEHDSGIIFSDKDLNIDWGKDHSNLIISAKDEALKSLAEFDSPFVK